MIDLSLFVVSVVLFAFYCFLSLWKNNLLRLDLRNARKDSREDYEAEISRLRENIRELKVARLISEPFLIGSQVRVKATDDTGRVLGFRGDDDDVCIVQIEWRERRIEPQQYHRSLLEHNV